MSEEQIIKKIISNNKKWKKEDPGGGITGSFKDNDTGKTYYYYYSCKRDKVKLYDNDEDAFDACVNDYGWFYNLIGLRFYSMGYKIEGFISDIREAFQRMKKGYCDLDIFEMDTWFLRVVPKMLRELRDKPSAPMIRDLLPGFDPYSKENLPKAFPKAYFKAWRKVLTEMIDCFEGYVDIRELKVKDKKRVRKQIAKNKKLLKRGFYLFTKYFHNLSW